MAVHTSQVTVTSSSTKIVENTGDARGTGAAGGSDALSVLLKNYTGSATINIRGATGTGGNPYRWEVADGRTWPFVLEPGEALWGISAGADQVIDVITSGRA